MSSSTQHGVGVGLLIGGGIVVALCLLIVFLLLLWELWNEGEYAALIIIFLILGGVTAYAGLLIVL